MFNLKKKATKIFLGLNQILGDILMLLKNWLSPCCLEGFSASVRCLLSGVLFKSACLPLNLVLDCGDNNEPLTLYSSLYPSPTPWYESFSMPVTSRQEIFDFFPLHRRWWTWSEGVRSLDTFLVQEKAEDWKDFFFL